ncbi:MAG: hypothetical protein ABI120_04630 [Gemmatimonadaceae bacterium]
MLISSAAAAHARRQNHTRSAIIAASVLGMLITSAGTTAAQTASAPPAKFEFRMSGGGLVATGTQRNSLKDAQFSAAQLSWVIRPSLAVTGTFGWARSRDVASVNSPKLDVFTSDLGIEARPTQFVLSRGVTFSPFIGVGAGARSYNYRKLDVDATNNLAGYGTVGGELGVGRVGVRIEARDYATGFKPLIGHGNSETRNDVVVMAALRFNRRASQN